MSCQSRVSGAIPISLIEPDISAYNTALVRALRSLSPVALRQFASLWGDRLGNRGLKQLAQATDEVVEKRLWLMIYDRPDLADLHEQAEEWFERRDLDVSE